jgi:hypothetical protein
VNVLIAQSQCLPNSCLVLAHTQFRHRQVMNTQTITHLPYFKTPVFCELDQILIRQRCSAVDVQHENLHLKHNRELWLLLFRILLNRRLNLNAGYYEVEWRPQLRYLRG